jgi:hypothetical protein
VHRLGSYLIGDQTLIPKGVSPHPPCDPGIMVDQCASFDFSFLGRLLLENVLMRHIYSEVCMGRQFRACLLSHCRVWNGTQCLELNDSKSVNYVGSSVCVHASS